MTMTLSDLVDGIIEFADHVHGISRLQLRADLARERKRLADAGLRLPEWWERLQDLVRAVWLITVSDKPCVGCGYRHGVISVNRRLFKEWVDLPPPADDDPDPHFVALCAPCFRAFRAQFGRRWARK